MSKQDTMQADSKVWADPTQNLKGFFVIVAVAECSKITSLWIILTITRTTLTIKVPELRYFISISQQFDLSTNA